MRSILFIMFIFILANTIIAQTNSNPDKITYYLIPQIALLNGDNAVSGQIQLTGGIVKKKWAIGIGTAIDYYKVRTVPLFIDLRTRLGKKQLLFSYINLGSNIAWPLETQYSYSLQPWNNEKSSFSNGVYTDLGIGYHLVNKKNNRGAILSLGYSMKTVSESYLEIRYRDFPPYTTDTFQRKFDYTFNRIVIRLGISL